MKSEILTLLIFSLSVVAPISAQTLHVRSLDPDFDAKAMAGKNGIVDTGLAQEADPLQPIEAPMREKLLDQSGLDSVVAKWDLMDQDLFLLHAKKWTIERLSARYPKLSKLKLKKLKKLMDSEIKSGDLK